VLLSFVCILLLRATDHFKSTMFIEEIILNTLLLADGESLFVAPEDSLQRRYTHSVLL
jgi:hypothetical protein